MSRKCGVRCVLGGGARIAALAALRPVGATRNGTQRVMSHAVSRAVPAAVHGADRPRPGNGHFRERLAATLHYAGSPRRLAPPSVTCFTHITEEA